MSTRSTIGYETTEGRYLATYCHYDGYPSYMRTELLGLDREQVEIMVTAGWIRGGIRAMSCGPHFFSDGSSELCRIDRPAFCLIESYAYMLRLDGEWVYLGYENSDPQSLAEYED